MKKADIIEKLSAFPYEKSQYIVTTGAAMVMHGVREETHDIDLGCSEALALQLEKDGCEVCVFAGGGKKLTFNEDIELSEHLFRGNAVDIDGFPVADLESIIEMKKLLGREKDFRDIKLIEAFLAGKNE